MSADMLQPPAASAVTLPALTYLVELYQIVLEAYYMQKIKDVKKRQLAIETDEWRYGGLAETAATLHGGKDDEEGINQVQLERLVEWKITHGKFRPFLLPQIRKNAPGTALKKTAEARKVLFSSAKDHDLADPPSNTVVKKALDTVCELTGVGPATGTLILSVFRPADIPFFQDELYAWIVSAQNDAASSTKLKYNTKEYFEIVDGVRQLRLRLGGYKKISACEVEKAAFVAVHWELVDPKSQQQVWTLMGETDTEKSSESSTLSSGEKRKATTDSVEDMEHITAGGSAARSTTTGQATHKRSARAPSIEQKKRVEPANTSARQSKRTKK